MQAKTVFWNNIRQQVLARPEVQAEYEALEEEFILTRQIIISLIIQCAIYLVNA